MQVHELFCEHHKSARLIEYDWECEECGPVAAADARPARSADVADYILDICLEARGVLQGIDEDVLHLSPMSPLRTGIIESNEARRTQLTSLLADAERLADWLAPLAVTLPLAHNADGIMQPIWEMMRERGMSRHPDRIIVP